MGNYCITTLYFSARWETTVTHSIIFSAGRGTTVTHTIIFSAERGTTVTHSQMFFIGRAFSLVPRSDSRPFFFLLNSHYKCFLNHLIVSSTACLLTL